MMRRGKQYTVSCIMSVIIFGIFAGGCSTVVDRVKSIKLPIPGKSETEKPKPQKPSPKPDKPAELPTPLPPLTPGVTPTPMPAPTPKPTPMPTPTPKPEESEAERSIQVGKAYREAGDMRKAIMSFERALELDPGNPEATRLLQETQSELDKLITLHLNKGIDFFRQDALEDAIREWDKVLELDPSNQQAIEYKERAQRRLDALQGQ